MADNFNVDFSLLGALPSVAGAARDRATLKETLADLKSTDPDSLERKASQLLAAGQMEAGLKLQAAALARRQLTQKGAADALQADFLSKFVYPKMGGGGAAPTEQAPNIPLTPAPQTPAPDPFQGPPGAIPGVKPQSALPPTGPQQAAAEPGPSDAIIAAAQQGAAQPQPQQLAGPPPTPNTLPGQTPVMSAETLNAAAAPALGAAPPQAAPQPATDPNTPIKMPAYQADAQAEAAAVGQALSGMPRQLMTSGPGRALMERFRDAMGKLKLDKEQQSWMEERISRRQAGKPDISFGDYKLELQQAPKRIEEAEKIYLDTEKRAGQSQQLISTLDRMSALTKDKDFVSGASANKYAAAVNETLSVLKILGVDPTQFKNRFGTFAKSAQQSAMLNEEFTSLSNQALMAHVGSFSKSFSDADRSFVEKIFPQILQTPGGIEKIIGHLREMAVYDRNASKVSRDYMKNNPLRATSWGVNEALSDYADKNPLFVDSTTGQPTKKGQEILDIAGGNQATTAPDTAAPAAAPATARKITAEDEGKIFDVGGKLFIIRNGKREPYS